LHRYITNKVSTDLINPNSSNSVMN